MSLLVSTLKCPNCGAPIAGKPGLRYALCIFCNTSLSLEAASTGAPPRFAAHTVSNEDVERIKQMLVDGKRREAIDLYAGLASVSREEAEQAVENVVLSAYWELTRHLPVNAFGFLLYAGMIGFGVGLATIAALNIHESLAYIALGAVGGAIALRQLIGFLRHLRATLVAAFGATGRGRVVKRAVVRETSKESGFLIVVVFEVTPDDGSPSFVDQETLLVGPESLAKLVPDNAVRVRFDGRRQHVYPISPVALIP